MARRTVVLIPPSQGKAQGGTGPAWTPPSPTLPALDEARSAVLAALDRDPGREPVPPAGAPTLPAIERYTGVLYRELDVATLPAGARRRLDARVLIVSGLLGLVGPRDPVPPYRLKMGDTLPPLGKLSTWWRPRLTDALADRVRNAVVWDLLPAEHAAALDWTALAPAARVTVRFVDAQGRTVSHWNKLLKGALARWLLTTGATDLDGFEHPTGYRLDPAASVRRLGRHELVVRKGP